MSIPIYTGNYPPLLCYTWMNLIKEMMEEIPVIVNMLRLNITICFYTAFYYLWEITVVIWENYGQCDNVRDHYTF